MLTIKSRLPLNSTRIVFAGIISRKEQKRHASLTMQTLNPLVKEVEYAVRGKNRDWRNDFFLVPVLLKFFFIDHSVHPVNPVSCLKSSKIFLII
jgi:hypothetical protein